MVVLKRGVMPDGTKIQLENWKDILGDDNLSIAAYPVAKRTDGYFCKEGEHFRLEIISSQYFHYSNEMVKSDYFALIEGKKRLEDLYEHFYYRKRYMYRLGMYVDYVPRSV